MFGSLSPLANLQGLQVFNGDKSSSLQVSKLVLMICCASRHISQVPKNLFHSSLVRDALDFYGKLIIVLLVPVFACEALEEKQTCFTAGRMTEIQGDQRPLVLALSIAFSIISVLAVILRFEARSVTSVYLGAAAWPILAAQVRGPQDLLRLFLEFC